MLKITQVPATENELTLRLDGNLTDGEWVKLEEQLADQIADGKTPITFDFSGVTYVDGEAATRLARIRDRRIRIINGSLFIETLLQSAES